jgi:hypothetical protein
MESKVSPVDGVAFHHKDKRRMKGYIKTLKEAGYNVSLVSYKKTCPRIAAPKRSARLVSCMDAGLLKGVGPLSALKIEL